MSVFPLRVGVICHSPSAQMSAQYDTLAELDEFDFTMLFRRETQGNPAWSPRPPERVAWDVIPPARFPWPGKLRVMQDGDVRPLLEGHDFEAMILHGIYDSTAVSQAIRWCRKHGKPYLLRCDANAALETSRRRLWIRRRLVGNRVRRAAALLTIGRENAEYYRLFGGRSEQMFLAPWEIDYTALEAHVAAASRRGDSLRQGFGVGGECVVLSVGRLIERKGFGPFVEALASVAERGIRIRGWIAGEGPFRAELESRISAQQAPVELLGNLDRRQLMERMVAADVFLLASYREPWGLVVNEAALCGLPMVLTDSVGAAADLVVPGKNGFVVPPGDTGELVSAISRLTDDPERRRAMGRASADILARWRREHAATDGYREALRKALGQKGASHADGCPRP